MATWAVVFRRRISGVIRPSEVARIDLLRRLCRLIGSLRSQHRFQFEVSFIMALRSHAPLHLFPRILAALIFLFTSIAPAQTKSVSAPFAPFSWPSDPPRDVPFQQSQEITGIEFTGHNIRYANADTWYPSWAADGNLYSPWTDGEVNGVSSSSFGAKATTGFATVAGDDPLQDKQR